VGTRRGGKRAAGLAGVFVLSLVATSCGARVPAYLGSGATNVGSNQAAASSSGTGSVTTTTAAAGATGSGTTAGGTGASGSGSGVSGSGSAAQTKAGTGAAASTGAPTSTVSPTSAGFNFSPQAEAADCPGTAGNTASAPGVTPNSVTFGNVSGLTGPLPGSFPQGPQAVQALFDAINAAGGICGRKLGLNVEDDQQNASTNQSDVANLIPRVLAFVGSTSDADNGGVAEMTAANIPDDGFAINCNRTESPVYWSAAGGSCDQPKGANGPYYIADTAFQQAKQSGYFPPRAAFLAYDIAISAQAAQQFAYVYQKLGGVVCYTDYSISPTTASLESDVVAMQQNNCNGSFSTMDVTGTAKLLQAMQQQNYTQELVEATFDEYTPDMIATAGQSAAQGLVVGLPFVPLSEPQTMVQMYQQQLHTYEPGDQPSGFGYLSWINAQMLIYALIESGHNPTRATLVQWLNSLQNWTGGGSVGPTTPSARGNDLSAVSCGVDVTIQGQNFVRKSPSSGFFCGGHLVQASP